MKPVTLRTARLVLETPTVDDVDRVTEYCQDPVFERYMTTPWPYGREHALGFLEGYVPSGWASDREFTWGLRLSAGGPLLGVVGWRAPTSDLGFWLGAPHRRNGYMSEAVHGVLDWLFTSRRAGEVRWEAVVGNVASLGVARGCGFRYMGEYASVIGFRDGGHPLAWHGLLLATDNREVKPGWPA